MVLTNILVQIWEMLQKFYLLRFATSFLLCLLRFAISFHLRCHWFYARAAAPVQADAFNVILHMGSAQLFLLFWFVLTPKGALTCMYTRAPFLVNPVFQFLHAPNPDKKPYSWSSKKILAKKPFANMQSILWSNTTIVTWRITTKSPGRDHTITIFFSTQTPVSFPFVSSHHNSFHIWITPRLFIHHHKHFIHLHHHKLLFITSKCFSSWMLPSP